MPKTIDGCRLIVNFCGLAAAAIKLFGRVHQASYRATSLMPLFGAHMSIAGGYYKALVSARDHACEAVQLFTKNSNQWRAKELTDPDIQLFRETLCQTKVQVTLAHDSYLINLASPDQTLYRRSIEAFAHEVERAERLGLTYLVTHPGAHVGS